MRTDHPRAVESREIFTATWDDGDARRGLDALAPDVTWHNDVGVGPIRTVHGRDQVYAMRVWMLDFFGNTFENELVDACASDDRVLQVRHETAMKDGLEYSNLVMYVLHVDPHDPTLYGRVETYARDRARVEGFWSNFPVLLTTDPQELIAPFLP